MRRAPLLPCLTRYTRAFVRRPAAISASRHVRGHVIVFPLKMTVGTPFPCDLPDIYFGLSIELSKVTLPSFHFLLWTYFFACLCFLLKSDSCVCPYAYCLTEKVILKRVNLWRFICRLFVEGEFWKKRKWFLLYMWILVFWFFLAMSFFSTKSWFFF